MCAVEIERFHDINMRSPSENYAGFAHLFTDFTNYTIYVHQVFTTLYSLEDNARIHFVGDRRLDVNLPHVCLRLSHRVLDSERDRARIDAC